MTGIVVQKSDDHFVIDLGTEIGAAFLAGVERREPRPDPFFAGIDQWQPALDAVFPVGIVLERGDDVAAWTNVAVQWNAEEKGLRQRYR